MQIAIRRVQGNMPGAELEAVVVAARKCRREMGFAPRMDALVACIEAAVGEGSGRRPPGTERLSPESTRQAEARKAYSHYDGLGARLETMRLDAKGADLGAVDELIRLNHERLRMLKARL